MAKRELGAMQDISLNRKLGRVRGALRFNSLPIAILAVAIGWLVVSRTGGPRGLTEWRRTVGRGLRQRLDGIEEPAGSFGSRIKTVMKARDADKHRAVHKKAVTGEPMAGYGA